MPKRGFAQSHLFDSKKASMDIPQINKLIVSNLLNNQSTKTHNVPYNIIYWQVISLTTSWHYRKELNIAWIYNYLGNPSGVFSSVNCSNNSLKVATYYNDHKKSTNLNTTEHLKLTHPFDRSSSRRITFELIFWWR